MLPSEDLSSLMTNDVQSQCHQRPVAMSSRKHCPQTVDDVYIVSRDEVGIVVVQDYNVHVLYRSFTTGTGYSRESISCETRALHMLT